MPDRDTPSFLELAELAQEVAESAADGVRAAAGTTRHIAATKSSATDLVTDTDRTTEARIVRSILDERPHDAILGEESGLRPGTSGVTWIIDPIDGTTNFVYSLAGFNISVAAAMSHQVVAGVVVDPLRHETFRATRGGGATVNGTRLEPSTPPDLARSLIGTGFAYVSERRVAQAQVVQHVIGKIRDIRRLGAAALDLCYVAAGRLDGYYESGLKPWDLAAGGLIAREAGCTVTNLHGGPPEGSLTIAATPRIADDLRDLLRQASLDGLDVEDPSARDVTKFGTLEV